MLINNVTQAQYVGEGADNMHDGITQHLAGHLIGKPIQGVSSGPQPGHGFEDEPIDAAERASQHTAQSASQGLQSGTQDGMPAPVYSLHDHASAIRNVLRPGA
jgi:hypothetical protein